MGSVPSNPRIYHITHVDNLSSIAHDGMLLSDRAMVERGGPQTTIGMSGIKQRRLTLPVKCHTGDHVGDYVPFYFCPRSVMLYIIHRANHPELAYQGGQGPILHLEADLYESVKWASDNGQHWAFTLSNAGAAYAEFRASLDRLSEIDWAAVGATDFRDATVKEGKQAEFLLQGFFPWHLVRCIGAGSQSIADRARSALENLEHQPAVSVRPDWYY